jgi:hypothetical protein
MSLDTSELPDDPVALRALAMALKPQLQARDLIIETLRAQLAASAATASAPH